MEFRRIKLASAILVAMALAGCASEQQQRAGTGALVGAGAGALAGQALGRDTKSTLAGAAGGAILGGVIGSATAPRRQSQELCRYQAADGSIYTAPCNY
ncbi:glycine zipper 2TM domain-containing protein [Chelativorans salis]|uniref:17 kDa surface antigen n=1 Tax=Chelativorans salis TaxID=2978478 RepID=A0ABT2LLD2_9HYPH|nr:glycine zipper 2TM domain-containing protein [Chelativorans sp. EGI FJ00035]MCT7375401.1 glycine zipper 2TM domain-containing protein [Chelativorans sp. EGI FJ00035]